MKPSDIKHFYACSADNNPDPGPELWEYLKNNRAYYRVPSVDVTLLGSASLFRDIIDAMTHASKCITGNNELVFVIETQDGEFLEVTGDVYNLIEDD